MQLNSSDGQTNELIFTNYYFDSSYKIIQKEFVHYGHDGKLKEYSVATKDLQGNFYRNYKIAKMGNPQKNISGSTSIQIWIPNDGSVASIILRNKAIDEKDPNKNYESYILTRSDKMDWDSFELPLTHSWSGGFYNYDGKFYTHPKFYSWLGLNFKDGKEVCAYGSITEDHVWKKFPLDQEKRYECINF